MSDFPFAVLLSPDGGHRSNGRKTDASSTKHEDGEQQQRAETHELSGGEDSSPKLVSLKNGNPENIF